MSLGIGSLVSTLMIGGTADATEKQEPAPKPYVADYQDLTENLIQLQEQLKASNTTVYVVEHKKVYEQSTVKVKAGDTLRKIGERLKMEPNQIREMNKMAPKDRIYVGQDLIYSQKEGLVEEEVVVYEGEKIKEVLKEKGYKEAKVKGKLTGAEYEKYKQELLGENVLAKYIPKPTYQQSITLFQPQMVTEHTAEMVAGVGEAVAQQYAQAITYGKGLLGVPYVFGGTSETGIDCSGYIYKAYNNAGISVPRTTAEGFYNMSTAIANPVAGDLVFFEGTYREGISHIGIYLGNGLMINAGGSEVHITPINNGYWDKHFVGYGRLNQLMTAESKGKNPKATTVEVEQAGKKVAIKYGLKTGGTGASN